MDAKIKGLLKIAYSQLEEETRSQHYPALIEDVILRNTSLSVAKLVFSIALAVNNKPADYLIPFANACHLMNCALHIVDDVADGDNDDSLAEKYGNGSALFTGLALWAAAQQKLLDFAWQEKDAAQLVILCTVDNIHRVFHDIVVGHLDDYAEAKQLCSEERYLERAGIKAGLFLQMLFRMSATIAGSEPASIERYAAVGYKLGILFQLKNDMESCYEARLRRNSLSLRIITLPVIYALTHLDEPGCTEFQRIWQAEEITDPAFLCRCLAQTGAIGYTFLVMHWLYNQVETLLAAEQGSDVTILEFAKSLLNPLAAISP